jgi:hypothetical protein
MTLDAQTVSPVTSEKLAARICGNSIPRWNPAQGNKIFFAASTGYPCSMAILHSGNCRICTSRLSLDSDDKQGNGEEHDYIRGVNVLPRDAYADALGACRT